MCIFSFSFSFSFASTANESCKPSFFNLDANSIDGCLACYCNSHSSVCESSHNHIAYTLESSLELDNLNDWHVVNSFNQTLISATDATGLYVNSKDRSDVWFSAPRKSCK